RGVRLDVRDRQSLPEARQGEAEAPRFPQTFSPASRHVKENRKRATGPASAGLFFCARNMPLQEHQNHQQGSALRRFHRQSIALACRVNACGSDRVRTRRYGYRPTFRACSQTSTLEYRDWSLHILAARSSTWSSEGDAISCARAMWSSLSTK